MDNEMFPPEIKGKNINLENSVEGIIKGFLEKEIGGNSEQSLKSNNIPASFRITFYK